MTGVELIAAERDRQIKEKGFDAAHDDGHDDGSILKAATSIGTDVEMGCRAAHVAGPQDDDRWHEILARHVLIKYDGDYIRRLVIAGALVVAEIERLQRKEVKR